MTLVCLTNGDGLLFRARFLRGVAVVTGEVVTTEAQEGFFSPSASALSVTVVSEAAELRRMPEGPGISF